MLMQGGGVIVNVSSIATRGVNRVPYSAAKGGVNALTAEPRLGVTPRAASAWSPRPPAAPRRRRAASRATPRRQAAREQVWTGAVVDQTMSSSLMKRYGTLDEQAAPILFLASDEASYVTGVTLPVAGRRPRVSPRGDRPCQP